MDDTVSFREYGVFLLGDSPGRDALTEYQKPVSSHISLYQTHHRGQATTLLFQAGIGPGPTDLLVMIMEV